MCDVTHINYVFQNRKKGENAWISKREKTVTDEIDGEDKEKKLLRGNIISILNKITPENFKDLSGQIIRLNIDNMNKLEIAVEIIFEKAVLEPSFSLTYANLCKVMSTIKFSEEQNPKVSLFRQTLANRCKKEFFSEKADEKRIDAEIYDTNLDRKLKMIPLYYIFANIIFLFKYFLVFEYTV